MGWSILSLLPLVVVVITSLETKQDASRGSLDLPRPVTFANFGTAFTDARMASAGATK